jgi:MFS family permease
LQSLHRPSFGKTASSVNAARSSPAAPRGLELTVFFAGVASLAAEIAASRLVAPYFGSSNVVWANVIGLMLAFLALGYWLGGRLADAHPRPRVLALVLLAAALLLAAVPFAARPLLRSALHGFDAISIGVVAGSFAGVLALFALPVTLVGAAAPFAVRLALVDVADAGRVAGRLYAISTVGSLTGTMLAALVLIPFAGTQRTFLVFAFVLALVAVGGLGWRFAIVPALLAGAIALPVGTVKAVENGRVLFEDESEQQYIRVIQEDNGDRILELNEGRAVHSILPRRGACLTADYWDSFLVLPFAARE